MKKLHLLIIIFSLIFSQHIFVQKAQASSFDFQLIPKVTKSSSSEGYFTKIPLTPLTVQKGKLDYYKQSGWDYISFEGDYDEKSGELKGVFTGATANNSPNSGGFYYCEFTALIKKGDKETVLKYYPIHNTPETLNHCYSQVVFDFEKNRRAPKDEWWPDDLAFEIKPLEPEGLEDSNIRFSDISGSVEVLLPTGYDSNGEPIFEDEEGWNYAKFDMPLPYGTKVRLGDRSRVILSMPDMSTFEIRTSDNPNDPGAEIMLPTKGKKESVLKLMAGQLWGNLKKMIKEGTMDIELGQAVAGIKGTIFILNENGTESTLYVLEGQVEFRSKVNQDVVIVNAGEKITAGSNGLKPKETFDITNESKKWEIIDYSRETPQNKNDSLDEDYNNKKPIYALALLIFTITIVGLCMLIIKRSRKPKSG